MSFDPGDNPSITITRQSKTPESPRPLQPPQPANIPVLQNQNDLLFNLVTSHIKPPFAARNLTAMDHEAENYVSEQSTDAISGAEIVAQDDATLDLNKSLANDAEETATAETTTTEQVPDNENQSTSVTDQPAQVEMSEPVSSNPQPDQSNNSKVGEDTISSNPFTEADPEDEVKLEQPQPETNLTEPAGNEVNYQALLEQIVASSAAAINTGATITADPPQQNPATNGLPNPLSTLPHAAAGLPPRPPPQDQSSIASSYATDQDLRLYQFSQAQTAIPSANQPPSNLFQQSTFTNPGLNPSGLPPPPLPSFQQPLPNFQQQQFTQLPEHTDLHGSRYDDEKKWPPHIQQMYEEFLRQEEIYTKDGAWDKFPAGSRLFVGNLPTELVTKRDIFNCFYRFGKIAQISIKQAYGFVQFMDKEACTAALHGEQGGKIKDRSMHLEVSKPPKSRGGVGAGGGPRNDRRRSRSPENRRPGSAGLGRNGRKVPSSDYRDEPRRRDDYRPGRSPSPRGFRRGDDYRDRSPGRYRNRSRSPRGRGNDYGRSPSPRRRSFDEDDGLPIPRRHPRDVPDVQLLLIDDLDKPFTDYLEKAFRDRGLRTAVLYLPQIPISSLVKRQIVEGVQAIIRLDRSSRNTGRIPIQVFDRSAGASNVRFDDYDNLDANTAAELVVRAKAKEAAAVSQIPAQYSAPPAYAPPQQYGAAVLQQALAQQPNIANLISSLDGPGLQSLLSAMQQPSTNSAPQPPAPAQADIQALLSSLGRQPASQAMSPQAPPVNYGTFPPSQGLGQQPNYASFPQSQTQQPAQYNQQYPNASSTPNVQGVLDRLGRWKQ